MYSLFKRPAYFLRSHRGYYLICSLSASRDMQLIKLNGSLNYTPHSGRHLTRKLNIT